MDLMFICTTVPKMAFKYLSGGKSIAVASYGVKIFCYVSLLGVECFLLAVMACDHCVATYHPLLYTFFVNQKLCVFLTAASWVLGSHDDIIVLAIALTLGAVIHMGSVESCHRAFTSCCFHLSNVGLYYKAAKFMYTSSASNHTPDQNKMVPAFYIIPTPKMNPLAHSLLNKEAIGYLRQCVGVSGLFWILLVWFSFFCDVPALLTLSCTSTLLFERTMFICCVVMLLLPIAVIIASYARVILAIIRMGSAEGRRKAFTTCSSHLMVVGMYFGAGMFIYMRPVSDHSPTQDKMVSAFYTILTPMLNHPLFSLRNKEVTRAFMKVLGKEKHAE
ncbi:Olfactory receptor 2M3 [Pteropus alecto]|uniref:Olfactory receptor 2M3 n=1 Tax=Pteropus alecto TaxID=9402 RepID=L5JXL6_PTEAL|nr:Olfactory receptor 2M3 [Pteropus alecto]